MPLTPGQVEYWNKRFEATGSNPDRAAALWDLARTLAGQDEAAWADLVRMLSIWTQARAGT
ncbi:hypothetical protein GCM10009760_53160 [Kitasatospora kazusensis]|uniref:Uncharacterized protein n=1 Tax=Kitasatospora kazusensis TaxID=407974 RepID=A0ABN3A6C3_9ACTN